MGQADGGFAVLLDGRPVRTPKKLPLSVPTRSLAEAMAAEWAAQKERIDPVTMPLSKLAITAIDGVAGSMPEVAGDIVRFAGSDLLCYRAEAPVALAVLQAAAWDPVLRWVEAESGARFFLAEGVMPVTQSRQALSRFGDLLTPFGAFALTCLHVMTTLTGSAFLALAVAKGRLGVEAAWDAAHLDEDWQIARWGWTSRPPSGAPAATPKWRRQAAFCSCLRPIESRRAGLFPEEQPPVLRDSRVTTDPGFSPRSGPC
ncbi:MAG: ATPase [Hyphomicrobium sp.]|nr:ATPase [Hyphomicrobium sp.]